jgi:translation initiation factor IF-3
MQVRIVANENIRSPKVVVIDSQGNNLGEFAKFAAISKAKAEGLDLVQVAEGKGLPICKIADYGKLKYEMSKKAKEAPKAPSLKEIRFYLNTSEHDLDYRLKQVREFLTDHHQVKLTIVLDGRERAFTQKAKDLLASKVSALSDVSKADDIRVAGRFISTQLTPVKQHQ